MADKEAEYPEHMKLEAVADQSQSVGEFLEWLQGKYTLGEFTQPEGAFSQELWPARVTTERLLADYFKIDLDVLEREKRAMLEALKHKEVDCPVCPGPLCERDGDHQQ